MKIWRGKYETTGYGGQYRISVRGKESLDDGHIRHKRHKDFFHAFFLYALCALVVKN